MCLCKGVVVVCVQCCKSVSVCVSMFCLVVLSFVLVQSGVGVHCVCVCLLLCATTLCCVVAHNNRHTP